MKQAPQTGGVLLGPVRREDDGALAADVEVAPGAAWFDGHFPGEPVLPAVGQITLLDRLHRAAGEPGGLLALDSLRLTAQVGPGDRLVARLSAADEAGRRRASLAPREGGRPVSSGVLVWGPAAEADAAGEADPGEADGGNASRPPSGEPAAAADFPTPAAVLPHRAPARLAEEVLRLREGVILCRGRVPWEHPSVVDGAAGAWMALELAAQASGLLQAAAEQAEEPRVGYVVRLRDARFRRPTLPAGAPLLATVELEGSGGPLSLYRVRVVLEADGAPLADATLGTFLPPAPG